MPSQILSLLASSPPACPAARRARLARPPRPAPTDWPRLADALDRLRPRTALILEPACPVLRVLSASLAFFRRTFRAIACKLDASLSALTASAFKSGRTSLVPTLPAINETNRSSFRASSEPAAGCENFTVLECVLKLPFFHAPPLLILAGILSGF